MKVNWRKILPHIASLAIIIAINVAYFYPQLSGKVIDSTDITQSRKKTSALKEYSETNNKTYLWNPAVFGGMPILDGAPGKNNLIYHAYTALRLGLGEPLGLYIAGCIMCYFLLLLLGLNSWQSVIFSVAMVLSTSNVILWEAGHNSKIRTLIFTPLLIGGILSIFERRKYLFGFIILSLGFSFSFNTRHPQMTYYILLVFMIYGFIILAQTIKKQDWKHFGKGTILVAFALFLGMATTASKTWSLYDYSKVTMRGDSILKADKANENASSSEVEGLAWDYAMQWSNGYKDLVATFIPGFAGGGSGEKLSKKSATYKSYKIDRIQLYWGNLPSTSGPTYIGASIIFLFIMGLFWVKGNIKWWLGLGAIWMLLLSMGRNFELLNHLLFDYLPFYSKFRAPSSVLHISSFFMAILSALAIKELFQINPIKKKTKSKKSKKKQATLITSKSLIIGYSICGGIALLFALLGGSLFDFGAASDARYIQQGVDVTPFISDRKDLMSSDSWRSFIIVSMVAGIIWALMKNKINQTVFTIILGAIVLFDILGVNTRYLSSDDFVNKTTYAQTFEPRPVDAAILNMEADRSRYRVHDLTIDAFSNSSTSVFHNTIGGYSATKMQRADDLVNRHLRQNNMKVLNMMNAKYFIVQGQDNQPTVQRNPDALGNAWFVSDIKTVASPREEIDALNSINTAETAAVLLSEFPGYLDNFAPNKDAGATIEMTTYEPDIIHYKSQNSQEGMAIFSEAWYGPNKGWQAYIDDQPVPHIRANYFLRALKIPPGNHDIKFVFRPKSFYTGEKISMASSIFLILLVLGGLYISFKNENTEQVT